MKQTTKRSFDVFAPGTKDTPPKLLETIEVEVENRTGQEFLTRESRRQIEEIRARHMGLMTGPDIKALRRRLNLTQKELTKLLDCGEKMVSYWENGHGFPAGPANLLLRLLDESYVAPVSLEAVTGPRTGLATERFMRTRESTDLRYSFKNIRPSQTQFLSMDKLSLSSS